MTRILERLNITGRKLSADERSAVDALNDKYPTVAPKAAPKKRLVLTKRYSRLRGAGQKTTPVVTGKVAKLEAA
jgi:hypothetical protein